MAGLVERRVAGFGLDDVGLGDAAAGRLLAVGQHRVEDAAAAGRSEEHTSELQSHVNLVCRLLLEKKKKKIDNKGNSLVIKMYSRIVPQMQVPTASYVS